MMINKMSFLSSQDTLKSTLVNTRQEPVKVIWVELKCSISLVAWNCVRVQITALRYLDLVFFVFGAFNFDTVDGVAHALKSELGVSH